MDGECRDMKWYLRCCTRRRGGQFYFVSSLGRLHLVGLYPWAVFYEEKTEKDRFLFPCGALMSPARPCVRACVRACLRKPCVNPCVVGYFGICNTETSMHDNCSPSSLLGDIHSLLQQLHNHINNSPQQSKLLKIRDALKDMTAHLE